MNKPTKRRVAAVAPTSRLQLLLALLVVACGVDGSMGRSHAAQPRFHALLIGIDRYPNLAPDRELRGNARACQALRETLVKSYGFTGMDITVLIDEAASRKGILEAFAKLDDARRVRPEDSLFVFLACRSVERGGVSLQPFDSRENSNLVPMTTVWELLARCPCRATLVAADLCGLSLPASSSGDPQPALELITAGGKDDTREIEATTGESLFVRALQTKLEEFVEPNRVFSAWDLFRGVSGLLEKSLHHSQSPQFACTVGEPAFRFYPGTATEEASVQDTQDTDVSQQIIPSLDVWHGDVRDALRTLFQHVKVNYVISPEVQGEVTVSLSNCTFEHALRVVLDAVRATYRIVGGIYDIVSRDSGY